MTIVTPTTTFTIRIFPDLDDPHNWCWQVRWDERRPNASEVSMPVEMEHTGPGWGENKISTPGEARIAAERYARTMARNLARSDEYTLKVTTDE